MSEPHLIQYDVFTVFGCPHFQQKILTDSVSGGRGGGDNSLVSVSDSGLVEVKTG